MLPDIWFCGEGLAPGWPHGPRSLTRARGANGLELGRVGGYPCVRLCLGIGWRESFSCVEGGNVASGLGGSEAGSGTKGMDGKGGRVILRGESWTVFCSGSPYFILFF